MFTSFIFDIDGTLIDSNDFHAQAWEKALAEKGKTVPFAEIRSQIGKGADQLLPEFLQPDEIKAVGKILRTRADEIFKREYMVQVRPFPKVRELFKKIRAGGGRIALGTSSSKEVIAESMIIAQIEDLVERSASADDAEESKPEPDIFHAAMAQLGNPARNTVLVVGDTPYDVLAAKRAGLSAIGLLCGGFSGQSLWGAGCRRVYRDPAHMLEDLDRILNR